jgi:hypothetical protein
MDSFLHEHPNFLSIKEDRWFKPFNDTDPTLLTFSHRLYQRVDGKKVKGVKLGDLVPAQPLKVQTRPGDGGPTDTDGVEWDCVSIGSLLCVRVLLSTVPESDVL